MPKNILSVSLKEYRKQKEMTQEELAELLEVSNKSISKWELGKGCPSQRNVIKISKTLDIFLEQLTNKEPAIRKRLKKKVFRMPL